jgi:cell fate regulator YaaT (PSP1 superfamily)
MNDKAKLVAGVQFRPAGKVYTFMTEDSELKKDDEVAVESEGGIAIATVVVPPRAALENEISANAKMILHKATKEELTAAAELCERAVECFRICQEKIRERKMEMKLADAEVVESGKKVIFTFFSEQRVDFRTLVKDLANILHMRIEMRQVGARDESKIAGSMGPCGLTTCCSTHLRQFQSISISMAKHQGLAPNPAKLTGMCGKLKCCLAYECAAYDECRQGLPKIGAAVESPEGPGKVSGHNVLKRECTVRLYGGGETRVHCDLCRNLTAEEREKALTAAREAHEVSEERSRRGRRDRNDRKDKRHEKSKE